MDYQQQQYEKEQKRLKTYFSVNMEGFSDSIAGNEERIKSNAQFIVEVMCEEMTRYLHKRNDDFDYDAIDSNEIISHLFHVNDMHELLSEYMKTIHNEIQRSIPNKGTPLVTTTSPWNQRQNTSASPQVQQPQRETQTETQTEPQTEAQSEPQTEMETEDTSTGLTLDFDSESNTESETPRRKSKKKRRSSSNPRSSAKKRFRPTPGVCVYVRQNDGSLEEYKICDARKMKKSSPNQNLLSIQEAKSLYHKGKLVGIFDHNEKNDDDENNSTDTQRIENENQDEDLEQINESIEEDDD